MTNVGKATGRALGMPGGLAVGLGVSVGLTLGLSVLWSWLWSAERVGEDWIGYAVMLTLAASSAAGAWCAWRKIRRRKLLVCGLSGVCYYLSLLALTAMCFGGQFRAVGVTLVLIAGSVLSVALLGPGGGRSTSVRFGKKRNREVVQKFSGR